MKRSLTAGTYPTTCMHGVGHCGYTKGERIESCTYVEEDASGRVVPGSTVRVMLCSCAIEMPGGRVDCARADNIPEFKEKGCEKHRPEDSVIPVVVMPSESLDGFVSEKGSW